MRPSSIVLVAVVVGMGCSSGGGGSGGAASASLDCAWLAGDNCWKSSLAEAAACLPPKTETGTLSADMKTCTYASGPVVTFDAALTLPLPADPTWSFTVTSSGQPCLRYQDAANAGFTVSVNGRAFTETSSGLGLRVTCPDGKAYANSNAFDLLNCPTDGGFLGDLPGNSWSDSTTSVSFTLINGANGMSASAFSCSKP